MLPFTLAAKCAPVDEKLSIIKKVGITAVELFLSREIMRDMNGIISLCRSYAFQYAVHAPNDVYDPHSLFSFVQAIGARILVLHDIYWDDEWHEIMQIFKGTKIYLCVENTSGVLEPIKFMRRYGFCRCLDLEHLQFEVGGIFEEEFLKVIKEASHIHVTGYRVGSTDWHTHIHHNKTHGTHLLTLLKNAGYSGMVVSEAKVSLQTEKEFRNLKSFFDAYQKEQET